MSEHSVLTAYGFEWGPFTVERTCSIPKRGYVLTVKTEAGAIEIVSSPKGRAVSVRRVAVGSRTTSKPNPNESKELDQ